ncbi:hypothetical protein [Streptomyces sp. NBC_01408]|uniref:hypothetical protein n=1 Tax=Streptomyces sp. NBC_01408 TaxID=2903855 RepID=UPI00224E1B65|nr:hypothetical protein [Streptomyces sp. NBC_01408]MCX4696087.1 hypothetical protein [Streptomyces sp. NBC_01408]
MGDSRQAGGQVLVPGCGAGHVVPGPRDLPGQGLRLGAVGGAGHAGGQVPQGRVRLGPLAGRRREQGPQFPGPARQPVPRADGGGPQPGRVPGLPRRHLLAAQPGEVPQQRLHDVPRRDRGPLEASPHTLRVPPQELPVPARSGIEPVGQPP